MAHFSGHVQGVGFRFTAQHVAHKFKVAGYVKNLSNGQVELVAEGEEKILQDFLKAVREAMHHHIENVKTEWTEAQGAFTSFNVRY